MWEVFKHNQYHAKHKRPYTIVIMGTWGVKEWGRGNYATQEAAQKAADKKNKENVTKV